MDGQKPFSKGDAARSIIQPKEPQPPSSDVLAAAKMGIPHLLALAKNSSQRRHMEACLDFNSKITFATGSAGGGRTFISALCAAALLKMDVVDKIIACRPAVTAGEELGYLPGDSDDKLGPFAKPIYGAFAKLNMNAFLSKEKVELVPLAYMRGQTFDNSAIIFDECQNATVEQMKMITGRPGDYTYLFANGDPDQCDLPTYRLPNGERQQVTSGLNYHLNTVKNALGVEELTHKGSYELEEQNMVVYDPAHMVRSPAATAMVNFYRQYGA